MNQKFVPFGLLFLKAKCGSILCGQSVILDLNNVDIRKYGFVCPFCHNITNADAMYEIIIRSQNYRS